MLQSLLVELDSLRSECPFQNFVQCYEWHSFLCSSLILLKSLILLFSSNLLCFPPLLSPLIFSILPVAIISSPALFKPPAMLHSSLLSNTSLSSNSSWSSDSFLFCFFFDESILSFPQALWGCAMRCVFFTIM